MLDDTKSHDQVPDSALFSLIGSLQNMTDITVTRNGSMIALEMVNVQARAHPA